jgi:hypothetical protein
LSASPRAGLWLPISRALTFWPRGGVTYTHNTDEHDSVSYHFGADADAFAIVEIASGFGLLVGPSLELPIVGVRAHSGGPNEVTMLNAMLSAGLVVMP